MKNNNIHKLRFQQNSISSLTVNESSHQIFTFLSDIYFSKRVEALPLWSELINRFVKFILVG